jgi:DNA polymerase-3 subunit alpha
MARVKSIEQIGSAEVYDIGVVEHHNFLANGIVAHNCMKIAQSLSGFTGAESNKLRKVLVKEKDPNVLNAMKEKFVSGAEPRIKSGEVTKEDVEKWWDLCHSFAGYGFNKAHAFEYAAVSSVEFWLKFNYPLEYMTALITSASSAPKKGKQPTHVRYINYARKLGIEILKPSVNKSGVNYRIEDGGIRFSLSHIKQVGKSAELIQSLQPFESIEDFFERVPKRKVNKRVVDCLIYAGAFDEFGDRNSVAQKFAVLRKKEIPEDEPDSFFVEKETDVIGFCLTKIPILFQYSDKISENKWVTIAEADSHGKCFLFGRVTEMTRKLSKAGNNMMVVSITDDIDSISFFVWSTSINEFTRNVKKGFIVAVPTQKFEDGNGRFLDMRKSVCIVKR